ncbi:MAG: hypothetical protein IKC17_04350 [Bacteroidales bacterium]|nr:hypothetical protein [Bacteroidales bacterium]
MRFQEVSNNQSSIIEIIEGMQEIKLNNYEKMKLKGWERIQARLYKINIKGLEIGQIQQIGGNFLEQTKNFIIAKVKLTQTHIIDSFKIRGEGTIIPSNNNLSGIKIGQDIYLISNDLSITKQIKGNITYISFEEYNNSSDSNKSHFPIIIEFETTHIEELKTN